MSRKSVVAKVFIALVITSAILYYNDYILGILTARPDFQLSVSSNFIKLGYIGSYNTTVITVRSINDFDSNVKLDVKPVLFILGIKFTLDPSEVHLPANKEVTCELKIEAISTIAPGKYLIDVYGISGNITRTVRITVEISY
jgi:hypothetical protein